MLEHELTTPEPNPEGERLVAEFVWVHGALRKELAAVRDLATRVARGADVESVQAAVAGLAADSRIWTLRIHCLHFCRFVHGHHGAEDGEFFPRLVEADESMAPVVDRLKEEHEEIARLVSAVEEHTGALAEDESARGRLVAVLGELGDHLLRHLDYEEASIFPTVRRMRDWRFGRY